VIVSQGSSANLHAVKTMAWKNGIENFDQDMPQGLGGLFSSSS